MSDEAAYTLDTKGLDKLAKALKQSQPKARVGILGEKAIRSNSGGKAGEGLTNAEVGLFHEMGTSTLPVRSFLRLPMTTIYAKRLEQSGAFDKAALIEVLKTASFRPWLLKAAVIAEQVVLGAFDTGGYGTWVPSNMRNKKVHMTLVESQQLRNSITSEVAEENGT